ncbi:Hypothetical protein KVN_LOCUS8 [uncultured virus]|nr:Hypothetical protein KVN_LOCUS8 [uncultured virus]
MNFEYEISDSAHSSKTIKIKNGNKCDINNLLEIVQNLENDKNLRTLHIYINENILKLFIDNIIKLDYKFRAYDNSYYQYYKWLLVDVEDKVHPYATSTSGCSVMILSPDESSVLFVHETNYWKFVTGSNNFKELTVNTAIREMFEEVGLNIDENFEIKVIGIWNIGGRSGGKINDNNTCYLVKSKSLDFKIDEFEVEQAKWISIKELQNIIEIANQNIKSNDPANWSYVKYNNENYGYPYLLWIKNWLCKKWFENHIENNVNIIY